MGTQTQIFTTDDDLADLIRLARDLGARALPELVPLDGPLPLSDPEEFFLRDPGKRLCLLPKDLAPVEVDVIEPARPSPQATVSVTASPVVEVIPARLSGDARAGRIYLGLDSSDSRYADAKRLYDALRKATGSWARAKQYDVRVGPRAAERVRAGDIAVHGNVGERLTLK